MKRVILVVVALLGYVSQLHSQPKPPLTDSVGKTDYPALEKRITMEKDSLKRVVLLKGYLDAARKDRDASRIVKGYKNLLHESPEATRLQYADSMVTVARASRDNLLIGSAYLTKGIVYYSQKKHMLALDNYLIADNYIAQTKDTYQKHKVKYNIAHIKYYLGYYHEAIALFRECAAFFKNDNASAYLSCLHSLGLCYNRLGQYDKCSLQNNFALAESERLNNVEMVPYINHSEGVNQYFKKNYSTAVYDITNGLPYIIKKKDFANEAVGYFYLGKCYFKQGRPDKALPYFKKVDAIFIRKDYIRPDLRENYELLIGYYKSKKDYPQQLRYINQLLRADRLLEENYKYLSTKIHKEYDTKKLLEAKSKVEASLERERLYDLAFLAIILVLVVAIAGVAVRNRRLNKKYRAKFEEFLRSKEKTTARTAAPTGTIDVNPEVVAAIISQLEIFEAKKKYLGKDLTADKLARSFHTNYKYLSKVVRFYKNKNFNTYINDLKIDHIVGLLESSSKFRNYKNGALAEEAGFNTAQHFTNAFSSKMGMSPTFFIREVNKRST